MTLAWDGIDVEAIDVYTGTLALLQPLQTSRGPIGTRKVFWIRVHAFVEGLEAYGFGEAAPLRAWGSEKPKHVRFELQRLQDAAQAGALDEAGRAIAMCRLPTTRFALESALADALGQARNLPLRRVLAPHAPHRVLLNATIGAVEPGVAARHAVELVGRGFGTLKIKVGADPEQDVARVEAVRGAIGRDPNLRLDANGAWTGANALARIAELEPFDIEYLEQPVPADDLEALARVADLAPLPIAADESCLPLARAHQLIEDRLVPVIVLKPSLLGGINELGELVDAARNARVKTVFTSAIDSAVARNAVAQLAAAWLDADVACGLATGEWFEHDVGDDRVQDGWFMLGSGNGIGFRPELATIPHGPAN